MSKNDTQDKPSGGTGTTGSAASEWITSNSAFVLVVIMLVILGILVLVLLIVAAVGSANSTVLEYTRSTLTALMGAFGAWIGAGAAYFFGKDSLAESSRSTEAALKLQQETLRGMPKPERISDLDLTAMNKDFMFKLDATKGDVIKKLEQHNGYWWVPVLDEGEKGVLKEIIHARVFWDTNFADNHKISDILDRIDIDENLRAKFGKLHGASFFVKTALGNKITDVMDKMDKSGAVVGVVADDEDRPTYCFTKQNLQNVQR